MAENKIRAKFESSPVNDLLAPEEIPKWLSESFIQNILRNFHKDETLAVKSFSVQQCGGKGESFVASMYRVAVNFVGGGSEGLKAQSLIMKTQTTNEFTRKTFGPDKYNVQGKEMKMYEKILPEFKRILESIGEDGDFFPKVLEVDRKLDVIVMEDLLERKFLMADRLSGLDLNHVKLALRKLAQMHAASAVVLQKNPKAFEHLGSGIFTRKFGDYYIIFETLCDALIDEMSTWNGYEYYVEKVKALRPTVIERTLRVTDCDDGDFHVLNHGDFWTNNMMFQYSDCGESVNVLLIDFQFPARGSPAVDLIYFIMGSAVDDLRQDRFDELIQFYYYELKTLLARLDYDMKRLPTLHSFQLQIQKKFFYAFTTCLLMIGTMLSKDTDCDIEVLMSQEPSAMETKRRLFRNPKFIAIAKRILPKFDTKGILDEM